MPSLFSDIRQLFSHRVLSDFGRLDQADVDFTYNPADVYLSSYSRAFALLEDISDSSRSAQFAQYAKVFEQFIVDPVESVNIESAALMSATLYWLADYSANAVVIARALLSQKDEPIGVPSKCVLALLGRKKEFLSGSSTGTVGEKLECFLRTGENDALDKAVHLANEWQDEFLEKGPPHEYVSAKLLKAFLAKLRKTSFWACIEGQTSAPLSAWERYMQDQLEQGTPILDLWPSQRQAIQKGLLDGESSLVLRMPTSSGKTKMTELVFWNDLNTETGNQCLYIAPFRALVVEVESQIGGTLSRLGVPTASLYGSSEANELEAKLAQHAPVLVATPEKIGAVLRMTDKSLADFGGIVKCCG